MNSTMWTYFFMIIGILGIVLINLFSDILLSNEQNYIILKETTEAAMMDAIDWNGYSNGFDSSTVNYLNDPDEFHCSTEPGQYRIMREKFIESFVRRFAYQVGIGRRYKIYFSDIYECPPKVSVTITERQEYFFLEPFRITYSSTDGDDIVNKVSAIIEQKPIPEKKNS